MKKLIILVIVLALVYVGVKLSIGAPEESIPSATEQTASVPQENTVVSDTIEMVSADRVSVSFKGYGPGKEHEGTVGVKESTLSLQEGVFSGAVVLDMATIASSPDQLVTHLKSADFFDVTKYPAATFTIGEATTAFVKGVLTMKGVSQAVTLPVSYDATTKQYSSTVKINMELFGIKQTFANKEFVVNITVK